MPRCLTPNAPSLTIFIVNATHHSTIGNFLKPSSRTYGKNCE
ncbi:uncharacterized protein J3R85_018716 [Psidium guajava]|nr:uncharacterized protein J3R85_018716 [Psidium guajava]